MNSTHGDWGIGMEVGMWIFWLIVIFIVVFIARLMMNSSGQKSGTTSEKPVDILKQRYARGEIDKNEFESLKQELEK